MGLDLSLGVANLEAKSPHPTFQLEPQLLSKGVFVLQRSFATEALQLMFIVFISASPAVWPKRRGRVHGRFLAYLPPLQSKPYTPARNVPPGRMAPDGC